MAWIDTIAFADATGRLKKHYERVGGPDGNVDNIMQVHSLRPHTLEAHMGLYKSTLHHSANTLRDWMLECIGVYVSLLNRCDYCVEHHFEGLRRLLNDDTRANALREALEGENFESAFSKREREALKYVKQGKLNLTVFQDAKGQGRTSIQVARDVVLGKKVKNEFLIPFELVTIDKVDAYEKRYR